MNESINTLPPAPGNGPRRLTRASDDKMIGGVAGGLGRYLDVDPVLVRLAFVVLALVGGSGFLLYLLAWIIVPSDGDTAGEDNDVIDTPAAPSTHSSDDTGTTPPAAVAMYTPV